MKIIFQVQIIWTVRRKHNGITEYTIQYNKLTHEKWEDAQKLAVELSGGKLYTNERFFQIIAKPEIQL